MQLLTQIMREIYHRPVEGGSPVRDTDHPPVARLDAEKLVPLHPLFKKLSLLTVKELLVYCVLLRIKKGHTIYREGDSSNDTSYIILYGKILLHTSKLGAIGAVNTGDSLGEEGLLEKKPHQITTEVSDSF